MCAPGWGTSRPFTCRECLPDGQIVGLLTAAAAAMLVCAKLLCHITLRGKPLQATTTQQHTAVSASAWFRSRAAGNSATASTAAAQVPLPAAVQQARVTDLVKPFLFYLQSLWVIANLQGIDWPSSLLQPMRALTWFFAAGSPQSLSLQCVLSSSNGGMPVPVQLFLISVLMPVAVMFVLMCCETLIVCIKHGKRRSADAEPVFASSISGRSLLRQERHKLIAQAIIVVHLFLPQILRTAFSLFACVPLDHPVSAPYQATAVGSFWVEDMSQQCWQGYHVALVLAAGIPLVALLCIVLPCAMLLLLISNRTALQAGQLRHYAFLCDMYRPGAVYWEAVVVLQIAALVANAVFGVSLGTYYGCFVLTAALAIVTVLMAWVRPYRYRVSQVAALRGTACAFFTSFAALYFMPVGTFANQANAPEALGLALGVAVLVANVAFVLSVLWEVLHMFEWKRLRKFAGNLGCWGTLKARCQKLMASKDPNAC